MCIYDIKYAVLYWLADWIGKIWNIMYTSGYDSSNNKINTSKINLLFFYMNFKIWQPSIKI